MTNKEKALELITDYKGNPLDPDTFDLYKEAIELASKPNIYYPSKGEFPELGIYVLAHIPGYPLEAVPMMYIKEIGNSFWERENPKYMWEMWTICKSIWNTEQIKSWMYFPKFEE